MKKLMVLMMAAALCLGFSGTGSADVMVADGGIGDVLLGPLYDLRVDENRKDGEVFGPRQFSTWQNLFVIENTSPKWTAVHLRFREAKCSVEVWDHIILLSPYDMFWFGLDWYPGDAEIDPTVKIFSKDIETLVNSGMYLNGVDGQGNPFYYDFFRYDLLDELCNIGGDIRFGHFEAIGLFQLDIPEEYTAAEDTHDLADVVYNLVDFDQDTDWINVYDVLAAAYYYYKDGPQREMWRGWIERNQRGLQINNDWESGMDGYRRYVIDCGNVLTGNYVFGDLGTAEMGLENLVALRDFRTDQWEDIDGATDPNYTENGMYSYWHRDRHPSGAIVFPYENLPPYLQPGIFEGATGAPGGAPPAACWQTIAFPFLCGDNPSWYLQPDFTTVQSATLRDGDSFQNAWAGSPGDVANLDDTYSQAFVAAIGSIPMKYDLGWSGVWSLDEVEFALAKSEIWYNYFQGASFGGAEVYSTEVVVTYPTKYFHVAYGGMPYWNKRKKGPGSVDYIPSWGFVDDYTDALIAWRCSVVCSGWVRLTSTMWDNDENLPNPGDPGPSPAPTRTDPRLYDETNIFWVTSDPGLETNPNVLYTEYLLGHFRLNNFRDFTLRYALLWGGEPNNSAYWTLPPIGLVYFRHTFESAVGDTTRSAMAEWHYKPVNLMALGNGR